jgi:hypothetical protein
VQEDAGHLLDPSIHQLVGPRHGILPSYDLTPEHEKSVQPRENNLEPGTQRNNPAERLARG